ncbi:integrin alpha 8 [Mytilus galloprovincialis]|uniref:Integrin alpha 8 n=2 Tax=Mytilus galloprovincialis TaxID=29158 RepID=A0A8B6HS10_MYTGA|nr:integrin alpha 8 [Mytilus galloprovincialis]
MDVLVLTCLICGVYSFNVDTDNVVSMRGPEGTYFGYSAVMYDNDDGKQWVIAGATKANFSNDNKIKEPGNIFKCQVDFKQSVQNKCEPMNLRVNDNNKWPDLPGYEEDNELLGASMSFIDDTIVTCAPMWKNMIPLKSSKLVHAIGRCFNVDRSLKSYTTKQFKNKVFKSQYTPENSNDLTFELAQIGFSISNKKYEEDPKLHILLGAPGFFENKGGFLQYSATETTEQFFDSFTHTEFESETQKQGIKQGSFMGYSITSGKLSDSDTDCPSVIVLGTPHFSSKDGIVGAVLVVCAEIRMTGKSLYVKKQFSGKQSGSGFGSSVAFDDINGDGLDDLLVGAPLQYNSVLDSGVVHIYYGDKDENVLLRISQKELQGHSEWGRFGTALQCIGDINKDGYNDVAISSPYEDNGKGSVYIYHGGPTELTFTQKIQAKDISNDLFSFGWYISAAYDIDKNNYSDFLIGSYKSDIVTVLRTRPIIKLNNTVEIFPSVIPLNSSELKCKDEQYRPCVTVKLCFSYDGFNVPPAIMVAYNISTDTSRTTSIPSKPGRVHLSSNNEDFGSDYIIGKNIQVGKGSGSCVEYYAIVQAVDRKFFESLEESLVIETTYGLSETPIIGEVQPILDNVPSRNSNSANFSTGCNGTCNPDLHIEATLHPKEIIVGETSETVLTVKVINTGDQSHGTQINIEISNNTRYIGFSQPTNEVTEPVDCRNIVEENNETHVQCDLRNTLFQQQQATFSVRFSVSRYLLIKENQNLGNFEQNIIFITMAETTSPDLDMSDNQRKLIASVKLHAHVELTGISKPDQLTISERKNNVLTFIHTYEIKNRGPSPLHNGTIEICLPVISDIEKNMMARGTIQVLHNSPVISWRVIRFLGEMIYKPERQLSTTTTTPPTETLFPTSTLPERPTVNPNRKRRETSFRQTQEQQSKRTIKDISCSTVDSSKWAIIEIKVDMLEKDQTETFDVLVNISENSLSFTKVSAILYKSIGTVQSKNDNRQLIVAVNTSYAVPSEIFPREVRLESEKVNIWIIVGGCVGGLLLLILVGICLWKCGFFKRKKKDHIQKWKRQSGYYAKRQSVRAGSTKSSNYKPVDW